MMRLRLKADGRIVQILPDGREGTYGRPLGGWIAAARAARGAGPDAAYARGVRARTKLTQAQFAARIGVPLETVRNWEQGKRSPRGPARALLKVIEEAPDVAFAILGAGRGQ
ncbi:MAG: helix-turn-helix domain-containing protein [Alphaproteobacteria bacterium]|nr:MAG: helix-turn-helix domain-containing protein [Alphaproteobacteria bacterium]